MLSIINVMFPSCKCCWELGIFNSQAIQVTSFSFFSCFDLGGQEENENVTDGLVVALWPPWVLCCVVVGCGDPQAHLNDLSLLVISKVSPRAQTSAKLSKTNIHLISLGRIQVVSTDDGT